MNKRPPFPQIFSPHGPDVYTVGALFTPHMAIPDKYIVIRSTTRPYDAILQVRHDVKFSHSAYHVERIFANQIGAIGNETRERFIELYQKSSFHPSNQ